MRRGDSFSAVGLGLVLSLVVAHFAFGGLDTWLGVLTALGTIGAVVVALFQDTIKDKLYPLDAELEVFAAGGCPDFSNELLWHLVVKNKSMGRPLEGCSVFVAGKILPDGSITRFAVPQAFPWVPAGAHDAVSTIWTERTLELGRLIATCSPNQVRLRRAEPEKANTFALTFHNFREPEKPQHFPSHGAEICWVSRGEMVTYLLEIHAAHQFFREYSLRVESTGHEPVRVDNAYYRVTLLKAEKYH